MLITTNTNEIPKQENAMAGDGNASGTDISQSIRFVRIFLIVASCSFVVFPDGVFTSKATNRPFTQAIMSGIPAVPYIPPCSFQQKHPGTVFKYRRILVTILFSDITAYPPKMLPFSLL
jgi:hypothetical protein